MPFSITHHKMLNREKKRVNEISASISAENCYTDLMDIDGTVI